ncbi:MAG: hypothetical protein ABJF01_25480 [bacterium]
MHMRRVVLLSCVALPACASANGSSTAAAPTPVETIRVPTSAGGTTAFTTATASNIASIALPLDLVWKVMPFAFDSLTIPVTAIDQKAHSIGNGDFHVRRRLGGESLRSYLNCGSTQGALNSETYDVRISLTTQLTSDTPSLTVLTTTLQAMARPVSTSGEYLRCSSTGALETRLSNIVAAQLKR